VVGTCGLGGACEVHVVPSRNIFPFIIIIIIILFYFIFFVLDVTNLLRRLQYGKGDNKGIYLPLDFSLEK
jgi:hypothetical protein